MMYEIGQVLVSEEIFETFFLCDLQACKGACCVEGDAGAPLLETELKELEAQLASILPFLPENGQKVALDTPYVKDEDGDWVTPLVDGQHCAYTVFNAQGVAQCGIELAWKSGKSSFQKPISCHLYPIRVQALYEAVALNYHRWGICRPACACGSKNQLPLYRFLKDALIRAYGTAWYQSLCEAAQYHSTRHKN